VQTDDHGRYVERTQFPAGLDVAWLTQSGESVDLEASAVPGRVTVFDFYATWCENCRVVDEMMIDYMSQHPDVAYRKINVVDWESPAGKAFLGDVAALPYLIIYDRNAKRVDAIVGLKPKHILERLDAARVPAPQRNGSE
jgi:thiol-disulfide isomerase/thioredoxin